MIPGRGSIGGGDLGLCAHLGAAVIGEGEVFVEGRRRPAAEALAAAGLKPAVLGPKDGLAILNASAVSCGHAATVLDALARLLDISALAAGLSLEGYAGNPSIFDPRLAAARPAAGQIRAAALFRGLLAGSSRHDPGAARSIQDALSFRTLSQVYGPVLTSHDAAVEAFETEINAAADNPLVMAEDDLILSTANFHTPAIALAFDTLAIALCHLATGSAYRTIKLMNPALSGLPKYLSPIGGASNGFNSLQKTASSLHGEIRLKAMPASLDALAVSETVEGPRAANAADHTQARRAAGALTPARRHRGAGGGAGRGSAGATAPGAANAGVVRRDPRRRRPDAGRGSGDRAGRRPGGGAVRIGGFSASDRGAGRAGLSAATASSPHCAWRRRRGHHSGAKPADVGAPSSKRAR